MLVFLFDMANTILFNLFKFYFLPFFFAQKYVIFVLLVCWMKSQSSTERTLSSKSKGISTTEATTDSMRETIAVTKGLAYDNRSSVTIHLYDEFFDVPQQKKQYSISYLRINKLNSERFQNHWRHPNKDQLFNNNWHTWQLCGCLNIHE